MLRPGESGRLVFHDGRRITGHVEWLQSDRFTLRVRTDAKNELTQDCSFDLKLADGAVSGRARLAHAAKRVDGRLLLTLTVLDFHAGGDVFATSLRRQLASPTAAAEEAAARATQVPTQRPHAERHHWENEERFRLR
jgi:hypothetical protein